MQISLAVGIPTPKGNGFCFVEWARAQQLQISLASRTSRFNKSWLPTCWELIRKTKEDGDFSG